MAGKKLKLDSVGKRKAEKKLVLLIEKILKTHQRSKPTYKGVRTITKDTGNLFRNIKPHFILSGNTLNVDIQMMEYYKWLDAGTKDIDPWFFTEELMDSSELLQIMDELVYDGVENKILDMISDIEKK